MKSDANKGLHKNPVIKSFESLVEATIILIHTSLPYLRDEILMMEKERED